MDTRPKHTVREGPTYSEPHIRLCTLWRRSRTSVSAHLIRNPRSIRSNIEHHLSKMLANNCARDRFRQFGPFGRHSPFFIDMPSLADALMEVDHAFDDSHGHHRDRRHQQRAILVDVKEVRTPASLIWSSWCTQQAQSPLEPLPVHTVHILRGL
jgi:hypothetical protein